MSGKVKHPKHHIMKNKKKESGKAVVLLSGGIDSTTTLYLALKKGYKCHCLIFNYGQRHKKEIKSAKKIASIKHCPFTILNIRLPWKGSSLLDKKIEIEKHEIQEIGKKIPNTYVPARNTIFLSYAVSLAETIGARMIFIGANAVDFSGYPDCRPEYYQKFQDLVDVGTKSGIEGKKIKIVYPLIAKSKKDIIKLGKKLNVPFELTWSCYMGLNKPCGKCDACLLREKAFKEANKEVKKYAGSKKNNRNRPRCSNRKINKKIYRRR